MPTFYLYLFTATDLRFADSYRWHLEAGNVPTMYFSLLTVTDVSCADISFLLLTDVDVSCADILPVTDDGYIMLVVPTI